MHNRVRRLDAIRYYDGAIDLIVDKLKSLFDKAKAVFSDLPLGKKILFVMANVIKLASAASITVDVATLVALKMEMIKYHALIDGVFGMAKNIVPFSPLRRGVGIVLSPIQGFANNAVSRFGGGAARPVILKLFAGALGVAIGMLTDKIAVAKKKSLT